MFDVEIRIPVDKNDKFDLTQQVEIARKYEKVYQVRDNVTQQLQSIAKVVVSI